MLLYGPKDVQTAKFLILNGNENEEQPPEERARLQSRDLERLDQMVGYCKTTSCLRRYLLDYFGEHLAEPCGHCSSCQGNFVERDITVEAQKILSGVARVERMYPYGLGVNQVIHMLRGSRNQRVLGLKLDTLPTYGILREVPAGAGADLCGLSGGAGVFGGHQDGIPCGTSDGAGPAGTL